MKMRFLFQTEAADSGPLNVSRIASHLLALVPLAGLIWLVAKYGVPVPFWDQWELVPLLEKTYQGNLTFHDLWAQHNEHRIIFPRLIMLGLARLTDWNIAYELGLNVALAFAIFAVLAWQIRRTARELNAAGLHWAVPVCSLMVFSISQYQNWLWGWQIQMLLNVLAVVGGLVLLAAKPFNWVKFAGAGVLGIVATYSFANGALFWPIGLLVLWPAAPAGKERTRSVAAWILLGVLTLGSYFWHYEKPSNHPPLDLVFTMPFEYVCFVLKYVGAICAECRAGLPLGQGELAFVCGAGGLAALCWSGWTLRRRKLADLNTLLPYIGVSLYSIASALVTGIARVGFGSDQALASRYGSMMAPLWVSLVVWLLLLAKGKTPGAPLALDNPAGRESAGYSRIIPRWLLVAVIVLVAASSFRATDALKGVSDSQAAGRMRLIELAANPNAQADYSDLVVLYPRPNVILERYPVLVKHRLSVFR